MYTKGDWEVENFNRDELGDWRLRAGGHTIMRLVGMQTPKENKANACLIAKSPRLYGELQRWVRWFNEANVEFSGMAAPIKETEMLLAEVEKK